MGHWVMVYYYERDLTPVARARFVQRLKEEARDHPDAPRELLEMLHEADYV